MAIMKCHYCKDIIENKEDLEINKIKNINRKFHKSKRCYENFDFGQTHKCKHCGDYIRIDEDFEEIPDIENGYLHDRCIDTYNEWRKEVDDWDKLYRYVKFNVLGYDENINLNKYQIARLKGLRDGKHILSRGQKTQSKGYPYHVIYLTFLFKTNDILYALKTKSFKDDSYKFDYIMAIIGSSINGIYERVAEQEKANTRLEETSKRLSERKHQEPIVKHSDNTYNRSELNKKILEALEDDGDGLGL